MLYGRAIAWRVAPADRHGWSAENKFEVVTSQIWEVCHGHAVCCPGTHGLGAAVSYAGCAGLGVTAPHHACQATALITPSASDPAPGKGS